MVLYATDGIGVCLSFKLEFPYSSNEVEYEAYIIKSIFVLHMGVQKFPVQGDSKLIIEQVNEELTLNEIAFLCY